jgi:hypothetical protein
MNGVVLYATYFREFSRQRVELLEPRRHHCVADRLREEPISVNPPSNLVPSGQAHPQRYQHSVAQLEGTTAVSSRGCILVCNCKMREDMCLFGII